ncbi:hypothetical protein FGO68_gene9842 [Halteria grandinella]|uniref:Kinesin motor domain-containing protein n=1 Tax=Halteria grandinella TaxID=5974 RepID=A0A8J8T7G4_HALGN|nr:hypothetical protein FGO68_gene9842 [Halteria grandinella]
MSRISEIQQEVEELEEERQQEQNQQFNEGLISLLTQKDQEILSLKDQITQMENSLKHLMNDLHKSENVRKHMHNHIQILKGNIRVFCRVKPLTASKTGELELRKSSMNQNVIQIANPPSSSIKEFPTTLELTTESNQVIADKSGNAKLYHFDCVFPPQTMQEEIFQEVKPFIQSAIDGENVCIFAYGQTGAGKTFTMEGPPYLFINEEDSADVSELAGILPRCGRFLFSELKRLQHTQTTCEISSLEVYCDQVRDLYSPDQHSDLQLISVKNKVVIQGQTWKKVANPAEFDKYLRLSTSKRVFSNNGVNERSSRSHHIFQVKFTSNNKESLLNIIDLAGSERRGDMMKNTKPTQVLSQSKSIMNNSKGNIGQSKPKNKQEVALQVLESESVSINKSLTTLGRIFMMIADRKAKVKQMPPYRESKLTRILQDSLSYETKTLMIVNVCSGSENAQQTKESLNFASQAMLAY